MIGVEVFGLVGGIVVVVDEVIAAVVVVLITLIVLGASVTILLTEAKLVLVLALEAA